jgi:stringent starvation protein B
LRRANTQGIAVNAKRECLEKLLAEGLVFIQLDSRVEGVDLPAHLRRQPVVGLNLSLNFRIEVFDITDEGIRASLSFQGVRHLCVVPWAAVFLMGLADGEGSFVFPESAPIELQARLRAAMAAEAAAKGADAGVEASPDGATDDDDVDDEPPPPPPPPRGRPQLRLVK